MTMKKEYLGDSVYAEYDGVRAALVLTTENGYGPTNKIVVEIEVLSNLARYLDAVRDELAKTMAKGSA